MCDITGCWQLWCKTLPRSRRPEIWLILLSLFIVTYPKSSTVLQLIISCKMVQLQRKWYFWWICRFLVLIKLWWGNIHCLQSGQRNRRNFGGKLFYQSIWPRYRFDDYIWLLNGTAKLEIYFTITISISQSDSWQRLRNKSMLRMPQYFRPNKTQIAVTFS